MPVIGNKIIELLFGFGRVKLLCDGNAVGVFDVFQDLPAQGPFADRFHTFLEIIETVFVRQPGKLAFEAFQVAEGIGP